MIRPLLRPTAMAPLALLGLGFALALLLAAPTARADDDGTLGVAFRGGTMGLGGEIGGSFTPYLGARVLAQGGTFRYNSTPGDSSVDYHYHARPFSAGALLDVRPFAGAFVLSVGALVQDNKLDGSATCPNGCRIQNLQVQPNNTARLDTGVSFRNKVGPYAGIGFNNDYGKPGLVYGIELGAFYQGRANVNLAASGQAAFIDNSSGVPVPYASADLSRDPIVQQNVQAERKSLEDEISRYRVYPNVAATLGYRF